MEIKKTLISLKEKGLFRRIKNIDRIEGKYIYQEGRRYLDFSSSNYLGYRDSQWMKKKAVEAVEKYGIGSGASRLVVGSADIYIESWKSILPKKKNRRRPCSLTVAMMQILGLYLPFMEKGM